MPYEFNEQEHEMEPQSSGARMSGPPRMFTSAGVLDPSVPPKKPLRPTPTLPLQLWMRVFAIVVLGGVALTMLFTLLRLLR